MIDLTAGTGLIRTDDHRYYWNDLGPFPGVTTVQNVLSKGDGLINWAKDMVANYAVENAYRVAWQVQAGDKEGAREFLKNLPTKARDAAADRGSGIHYYAEQIGLGKDIPVPAALWPSVRQYVAWREQWPSDILEVEYQGINLTHRYGGTGDLIVRKDGETWCLDIKSGNYYNETALQLVACSRFDFIGQANSQETRPVPKVDRYGVLDLKDDGWKVVPYRFDVEAVFGIFTDLCRIYHAKVAFRGAKGRDPVTGRAEEISHDAA